MELEIGKKQKPTQTAEKPAIDVETVEETTGMAAGLEVIVTDAKGAEWAGVTAGVDGEKILVDIDGTVYPFHADRVGLKVAGPAVEPAPEKAEKAELVDVDAGSEESHAVVTRAAMPGLGEMAGELDMKDLIFPRLNLVQSVGPLSEEHAPGTLLLQKQFRLLLPKQTPDGQPKRTEGTLWLTVMNTRLQYREVTPYDSEGMGATANTKAEVEEQGGTTDWEGGEPPTWDKEAICLVMIRATTDEARANLPLEHDGEKYALALVTFKRTSFNCYRDIFTHAQYRLKNGLHTGAWQLEATREKKGENFVWVPHLIPAGENSPEMIKFIEGALGA
jgi:hypothetical protein